MSPENDDIFRQLEGLNDNTFRHLDEEIEAILRDRETVLVERRVIEELQRRVPSLVEHTLSLHINETQPMAVLIQKVNELLGSGVLPDPIRANALTLRDLFGVIMIIAHEMGDSYFDGKKRLQANIVRTQHIPDNTKWAIVAAVDDLVVGEGIDFENPDELSVIIRELEAREDEQDRLSVLKTKLKHTIRENEIDITGTYCIHENDPVWESIRGWAAFYLAQWYEGGESDYPIGYHLSFVSDKLSLLRIPRDEYAAFIEGLKVKLKTDY